MAKLPAVRPRAVIRFLEQNGFVLDRSFGQPLCRSITRFRNAVPLCSRHNLTLICQRELLFALLSGSRIHDEKR